MKNRSHKIVFLFGLYIVFHFIAACTPNCDCPEGILPFYDYSTVKITHNNPELDGTLVLDLDPDSIQFLAEASRCPHVDFMSTADACSCNENGDNGDKFSITAMNIYADQDFNDTLTAGMPLNRLFFLFSTFGGGKLLDSSLPASFGFPGSLLHLETAAKPKNEDLFYRFTVEITKSNGSTVSIQTDLIHF